MHADLPHRHPQGRPVAAYSWQQENADSDMHARETCRGKHSWAARTQGDSLMRLKLDSTGGFYFYCVLLL